MPVAVISVRAKRLWHDLLSGFSLLTRIPMPAHQHSGAGSAWSWPLIGATLGLGAAALAELGLWLGLAPAPLAALLLIVLALGTGALHEDGLSDTADGLLGGRDRARRLEIMKDSRIGSYGALALILICLLQWSALSALLPRQDSARALIVACALSRLPMVWLMALMPNARPSGISASSGRPSPLSACAATAVALLLGVGLLGPAVLAVLLAMALPSLLLVWAAQRLIGGQTGDILGASQQLGFAAALLALSTIAP